MHVLNYFFTPFGIILIAFAIYFSTPEKNITYLSLSILVLQFIVNFIISKNIYKFFKHMKTIRISLIIFNTLTTSFIFYFLFPYWAPMWLLFIIPSATGAMFLKKWGTFFISIFTSSCMLLAYEIKSITLKTQLPSQLWAMAFCSAIFIIIFSMFINSMSEMMLKLRDKS